MQKIKTLVLLLLFGSVLLYADKGKVRIASDKEGAYIYVDGKKKAMTGEGFTSILLEEGDHKVKVVKPISESLEYSQSKDVFVGADSSVKLKFKLEKGLTELGKEKLAKRDAKKLSRWKRNGEVVVDTKLNLMWQDNSEVKTVKKKWKEAKKYCQNLSLAGFSDWRLPSYDELLSVVDYDRYDTAIMPSFKNVTSSGYWSSSVARFSSKEAWNVLFRNGYAGYGPKSYLYYVRCVRGRQ